MLGELTCCSGVFSDYGVRSRDGWAAFVPLCGTSAPTTRLRPLGLRRGPIFSRRFAREKIGEGGIRTLQRLEAKSLNSRGLS